MTVWAALFSLGMPEAVSRSVGRNSGTLPAHRAAEVLAGALLLSGGIGFSCCAIATVLHETRVGDVGVGLVLSMYFGMLVALGLILSSWLRALRRGALAEWPSLMGAVAFLLGAVVAPGVVLTDAVRAGLIRVLCELGGPLLAGLFVLWVVRRTGDVRGRRVRIPPAAAAMWMTTLSWLALQQGDVLLLGAIRGDGAVGMYGPILRTADLAAVPFGLVAAYALPAAARLHSPSDHAELARLYGEASRWAIVFASPILVMLVAIPEELVQFLFGANIGPEGAIVARVLALAYGVNAVLGVNDVTLEAVGNVRSLALRSLCALAIGLGANLLLIPDHGAVGAALATFIGYLFLNVLNSILLFRRHGVAPWQWQVRWPTFSMFVATTLLLMLNSQFDLVGILVPVIGIGVLLLVGGASVAASRLAGDISHTHRPSEDR
jgi:O-antigen/teichoic acid export membrane protein